MFEGTQGYRVPPERRRAGNLYPDIEAALLVLWGGEDRWVDVSEGARFAGMVPNSEFVTLPDAGHFVMLDAPGLFVRYLREWLERLGPTG